MANKSRAFTKRRALTIVFAVAAALVFLILLRSCGHSKGPDLSTQTGRVGYLQSLGWEVDAGSEEHKSVLIPDSLDGIIDDYNEMQLAQGFDLSGHLGERCEQYSYRITNYPDATQTVLVTLYVQGRQLIAGDVHSTALDGFMHGLKME